MRVTACFIVLALVGGCGGETGASSSVGAPAADGGNPSSATGGDGGEEDAGRAADPFAVPATCTSGTMWTRGNHGSPVMNPGRACLACHMTSNGPALTIGGTVYPTAHEPDLCNGVDGSTGARVTIVGADGQTVTLTPEPSGNFNIGTRVMFPYRAKVTYMGRERAMTETQTSGDCNGCHTQTGANGAPGRILLP